MLPSAEHRRRPRIRIWIPESGADHRLRVNTPSRSLDHERTRRRSAPILSATLAAALGVGVLLAVLGPVPVLTGIAVVAVAGLIPFLLALRYDEAIAIVIVAAGLFIDWYELVDGPRLFGLSTQIAGVSTLLAFVLVSVMLLSRSPERPWIRPPFSALWALLLLVAVYPMIQGASISSSVRYYVSVFLNALLAFIIGVQIGRDTARVHRLLSLLAAFGTLIAVHTVVYVRTGAFFLATHRLTDYLTTNGEFALAAGGAARAGSFLFNPDLNGAFLALIFFIPVALFSASRSPWSRLVYLGEGAAILLALLFTYSTAALLAVGVGLVLFVATVAGNRRRIALGMGMCAIGATIAVAQPPQLQSLTLHATNPAELMLREGAWGTAAGVIAAYPLAGIGLDPNAYDQRSEPYRLPEQYIPLGHPHEAYLELGALAGLPVLCLFVAIVCGGLVLAWRNYRRAIGQDRTLLAGAGCAVIVLSINSLAINGWTLGPLALIGWLVLGAIASPGWLDGSAAWAGFGEDSRQEGLPA
jgi:O-antigen ligase